jgi:hypothetical protein
LRLDGPESDTFSSALVGAVQRRRGGWMEEGGCLVHKIRNVVDRLTEDYSDKHAETVGLLRR